MLHDVLMLGKKTLLVASSRGIVWRSGNAGVTWRRVDTGTLTTMYGLPRVDATTTALVGESGLTYVSTDAGRSWRPNAPVPGTSIFSVGAGWSSCLAVGTHGTILRSTDGGRQWVPAIRGPTGRIRGIAGRSPLEAWAVGDAGTLLMTVDGLAWTALQPPVATRLDAVAFARDGRGCAVGAQGTVIVTPGGGAQWSLALLAGDHRPVRRALE